MGRGSGDLDIACEVGVLHDLAGAGGVDADDATAPQVQHVAPVHLRAVAATQLTHRHASS